MSKVPRDERIAVAITGEEDLSRLGVQIEDNYLAREYWENRREQGLHVPRRYLPEPRSSKETEIWLRQKLSEELEAQHGNKPETEYAGGLDEIDRAYTKSKTVEII